jgi:phosphoglycolate phosphatase
MIVNVIWDWNGTLLNDVDICISAMNKMLRKRNLPLLYKEKYLDIFEFPVLKYYEKLGFDFHSDSFEELSMEFINDYHLALEQAELYRDVEECLQKLQQRGYKQMVLSAMELNALNNSIKNLGVYDYFENITGLNDHYAAGKIQLAEELIYRSGIKAEETIFMGDTTHDYEVAEAIGADCILIARGHHSEKRLAKTTAKVEKSIKSAILHFLNS